MTSNGASHGVEWLLLRWRMERALRFSWLLLRIGDSYGISCCWPARETTMVMGGTMVHGLGARKMVPAQQEPWRQDPLTLSSYHVSMGVIT